MAFLCELYNKEHENKIKSQKTIKPEHQGEIDKSITVFKYGEDSTGLPYKVQKWAGIYDPNGIFKERKVFKDSISLADINDKGTSFKEIAEIIEEQWENI